MTDKSEKNIIFTFMISLFVVLVGQVLLYQHQNSEMRSSISQLSEQINSVRLVIQTMDKRISRIEDKLFN